jgi:hypothetical protein
MIAGRAALFDREAYRGGLEVVCYGVRVRKTATYCPLCGDRIRDEPSCPGCGMIPLTTRERSLCIHLLCGTGLGLDRFGRPCARFEVVVDRAGVKLRFDDADDRGLPPRGSGRH